MNGCRVNDGGSSVGGRIGAMVDVVLGGPAGSDRAIRCEKRGETREDQAAKRKAETSASLIPDFTVQKKWAV